MTDERKEFEAMVKSTWGDTYSFAQDEYYRDLFLMQCGGVGK